MHYITKLKPGFKIETDWEMNAFRTIAIYVEGVRKICESEYDTFLVIC